MDFERYTDRAKGFVQSAQSLALGKGISRSRPSISLKVLLDDPEGAASGLIDACRRQCTRRRSRRWSARSAGGPRSPAAERVSFTSRPNLRACSTPPRKSLKRPATGCHRRAAAARAYPREGLGGRQDPGRGRGHA